MTKQLEKAIDELRALPEPEQDAIAQFVLDALAEWKWDRLLESETSLRLLEKMAEAARQEHEEGETIDLDDICR